MQIIDIQAIYKRRILEANRVALTSPRQANLLREESVYEFTLNTAKAAEPFLDILVLDPAKTCPECYRSSLVFAEGCKKCPLCGFSEC